jgi:hypothetical protein
MLSACPLRNWYPNGKSERQILSLARLESTLFRRLHAEKVALRGPRESAVEKLRSVQFDYLTELLRHAEELQQNPPEWMPWNYRDTLARLAVPAAA